MTTDLTGVTYSDLADNSTWLATDQCLFNDKLLLHGYLMRFIGCFHTLMTVNRYRLHSHFCLNGFTIITAM